MQTTGLTLTAAVAVAAAFQLQRLLHPELVNPYHPATIYVEVVVRGSYCLQWVGQLRGSPT
jgi:hypothetical protein